jgi:hypothetical protein
MGHDGDRPRAVRGSTCRNYCRARGQSHPPTHHPKRQAGRSLPVRSGPSRTTRRVARSAPRSPPKPRARISARRERTGHGSLEARQPAPPRWVGPARREPRFSLSAFLSHASLVCQELPLSLPPWLSPELPASLPRIRRELRLPPSSACSGGRDPARRLSPAARYGTTTSPLRACLALLSSEPATNWDGRLGIIGARSCRVPLPASGRWISRVRLAPPDPGPRVCRMAC